MKISAVIITYNESANIARCIDSLKPVADEIVVVDSYSTDDTPLICQNKEVRVVQHPFAGHIEQKNFAMQQAQWDYILSLDADEALSEELTQSILAIKHSPTPALAYSMNRLTNYCGRWIRHGGWYPDKKVRLWHKRYGQWGGMNPHDKVLLSPGIRPVHLRGDILHYTVATTTEHLIKAQQFATIAAHAAHLHGQRSNLLLIGFSPIFKFIRDFILRLGFLDGVAGWHIARISAMAKYWKYSTLYALNKSKSD